MQLRAAGSSGRLALHNRKALPCEYPIHCAVNYAPMSDYYPVRSLLCAAHRGEFAQGLPTSFGSRSASVIDGALPSCATCLGFTDTRATASGAHRPLLLCYSPMIAACTRKVHEPCGHLICGATVWPPIGGVGI